MSEPILGKLIEGDAVRDAVHFALYPVVAGEDIVVGDYISVVGDKAYSCVSDDALGIADPFLFEDIAEGDKFWCMIMPNTVTDMKHHWSHPKINGCSDPEDVSKRWLEKLVASCGMTWDQFEDVKVHGYDVHMGDNEDYYDISGPEFEKHFKNVYGKMPNEDGYWTCSC